MKSLNGMIYSSRDLERRDFRSLVRSLAITFLMVVAFLVAIYWAIAPADAATAPTDATLSWGMPVAWDDGTLITTPVTYNVYQATTKSRIATGLTKPTFFIGGIQPGKNCWYVTAVVEGTEGVPTESVCKVTRAAGSKPSAPVNPKAV